MGWLAGAELLGGFFGQRMKDRFMGLTKAEKGTPARIRYAEEAAPAPAGEAEERSLAAVVPVVVAVAAEDGGDAM